MFILQTTQTPDDDGYAGVNELAGTDVDKTVLDKNPLFRQAERFIIGLVPDADVRKPGQGTGRSYPQRDEVISSLEFIAASYIIRGAEKVGDETITQGTGALKTRTRTIGLATETDTFDVGTNVSRSGGNDIGASDRATFLYEQGLEILKGIGVDISAVELESDVPFVVQTGSRVKSYYDQE